MRYHFWRCALVVAAAALTATCVGGSAEEARLSVQARAGTPDESWRPLFDGRSLAGWRSFTSDAPAAGWRALDGMLVRDGSGGDLLTADEFGDFELRLQWKIAAGGNSGIFFRVRREGAQVWECGPEMQILDNARHVDGKEPRTSAGANYGLHAPVRDVTRPVGEWNDVTLRVADAHVEHWLNGVKVVEYQRWSREWEALVKSSKFVTLPAYGRARRGHIALQDHGDPVWFRDLRIRPL